MSNRKERRTEGKVAAKVARVMPNISGTDRQCGNCANSPPRERMKEIVIALTQVEVEKVRAGLPSSPPTMPPEDEIWCLAEPQERAKKTWGWCAKWAARV